MRIYCMYIVCIALTHTHTNNTLRSTITSIYFFISELPCVWLKVGLSLHYRNARLAEKDITIGDIHIPAGVSVDVPIWGMTHDEEYWDEPYEYKPER